MALFFLLYLSSTLSFHKLAGDKDSPYVCHLLLSPSCSVMFLLNWMLLLQPLLEPNGENGSENNNKNHKSCALSLPLLYFFQLKCVINHLLSTHQWRSVWTPVCVSSPAAPGPGQPGRLFPQKELSGWGRGRHSVEGWSWWSRFQPRTPGGPKDSARSRC